MATWKVGAARDLSVDMEGTWDAAAAKARVFTWAGFDGDSPDTAKAAKAFLVYDSSAADLKGSYKLPFADVQSGKLVAVAAAIRNAASRLPQTDLPADVRDRARAVIDGYMGMMHQEAALAPTGMQYKAYPAEYKASGDKGQYEGYFSIFGNLDDGGDVITLGAFSKTLSERAQPGRSRIKVFYGHDWSKLIGPPPDVLQEDSKGLYAKGRLTLSSFWGNEAWQLMKDGALTEGSIGFELIPDKTDFRNDGARLLKEVKLYEISPVPLGMNPLTEVQAIKSLMGYDSDAALAALLRLLLEIKSGQRHSAKDNKLIQGAHDALVELGATCAPPEDTSQDSGKSRAADTPALTHVEPGPSALARASQLRAAERALAQLQQLAVRSRR